ncbi:hypothetical protein PI125_g18922 [Phytophthora idaei]|nr:hypothetical protein PI125_g18922 [Phytophthora idaei]
MANDNEKPIHITHDLIMTNEHALAYGGELLLRKLEQQQLSPKTVASTVNYAIPSRSTCCAR